MFHDQLFVTGCSGTVTVIIEGRCLDEAVSAVRSVSPKVDDEAGWYHRPTARQNSPKRPYVSTLLSSPKVDGDDAYRAPSPSRFPETASQPFISTRREEVVKHISTRETRPARPAACRNAGNFASTHALEKRLCQVGKLPRAAVPLSLPRSLSALRSSFHFSSLCSCFSWVERFAFGLKPVRTGTRSNVHRVLSRYRICIR